MIPLEITSNKTISYQKLLAESEGKPITSHQRYACTDSSACCGLPCLWYSGKRLAPFYCQYSGKIRACKAPKNSAIKCGIKILIVFAKVMNIYSYTNNQRTFFLWLIVTTVFNTCLWCIYPWLSWRIFSQTVFVLRPEHYRNLNKT